MNRTELSISFYEMFTITKQKKFTFRLSCVLSLWNDERSSSSMSSTGQWRPTKTTQNCNKNGFCRTAHLHDRRRRRRWCACFFILGFLVLLLSVWFFLFWLAAISLKCSVEQGHINVFSLCCCTWAMRTPPSWTAFNQLYRSIIFYFIPFYFCEKACVLVRMHTDGESTFWARCSLPKTNTIVFNYE